MEQPAKNLSKFRKLLDRFIVLKRLIFFAAVLFVGIAIYRFLVTTVLLNQNFTIGVVLLWFFTAYLVLPRAHRLLTKIYLPDYFIGRTRTGDGILGDPINLAYLGTKKDLEKAMKNAGWIEADELNWRSTYNMIKASVLRRSYPNAPFSSLFLFGRKQTLGFQQEVDGSTKERHHVRFWKTPKGWYLPGGFKADYLGAATYDRAVGVSLYTFQITHKIEENIDIERDYVLETVLAYNSNASVDIVENFTAGYHTRNGGGDTIKTDGNLPFLTIK